MHTSQPAYATASGISLVTKWRCRQAGAGEKELKRKRSLVVLLNAIACFGDEADEAIRERIFNFSRRIVF
jgi:hypothetical protein